MGIVGGLSESLPVSWRNLSHYPVSGVGIMPYVITEPCVGVKDASCLDVCPVDCIATTDEADMYHIDPEICIDCSYCESVCPVNAIFDEFAVPAKWRDYIRKNRDFFK